MQTRRNAELLHAAGAALYGPRWQSDLARDLGVSIRTMQRWAAGQISPPRGIYVDLLRLVSRRCDELACLEERLRSVCR